MSKISKEGYEQITVIKNALDTMYDKLQKAGQFTEVQEEFGFIAGLVDQVQNEWEKI